MYKIELDVEEHSTVLAALRFYQVYLDTNLGVVPPSVEDIATNGDEHSALDANDIDDLCEKINGAQDVD